MSTPITLAPCPFCAGPPATFACNAVTHKPFDARDIDAENGSAVSAHIFCHECGAQGQTAYSVEVFDEGDLGELIAEACANWNQRDERHRSLYNASAALGYNIYPRAANDG